MQAQAGAPSAEGTEIQQHRVLDQSVSTCCHVLQTIKQQIQQVPQLVGQSRQEIWNRNAEAISMSLPKTVIGVLGNTGVGKSSLLNALLDEASILPTSGSRGCTAAVVELRYNEDLRHGGPKQNVQVYKGVVEFIRKEDWEAELKTLVEECCTHENRLYKIKPLEKGQQDDASHAAWEKIDQVYGKGHLLQLGKRFKCGDEMPTSMKIFQELCNDRRVTRTLTPPAGQTFNSHHLSEGEVGINSSLAKALIAGDIKTCDRETKRRWAMDFRAGINSFV